MWEINSFRGKHAWLSNFSRVEITLSNHTFPTLENAYQAAKCANADDVVKFVNVSPGKAKRLSKTIKVREDWHAVKLSIMAQLLWLKFQKEPYRTLLLQTDDMTLIEGNTWGDTFWGVCNGRGENWLGKLLMETRNQLKRSATDE